MMDSRARLIKDGKTNSGPVMYWMSRDQRVNNNWALLYSQSIALQLGTPLSVVFCLSPGSPGAALRQYEFMLKGLRELEKNLFEKNISFILASGHPGERIPGIIRRMKAGCLVTDFGPLRIERQCKEDVMKYIDIPFHEVDAHNIVPCWTASPRQEYAAYTFRPKISKRLEEFLVKFPKLKKHPGRMIGDRNNIDWEKTLKSINVDRSVRAPEWIKPGEKAAAAALRHFIEKKLKTYDSKRNDPTADAQSNLSPYLHFGHISAQHIALKVRDCDAPQKARDAFLEELIVRRELSDNFCFYNKAYDSFEGFPAWARQSLDKHGRDRREYLYSLKDLETASTHDRLWNAAQTEMVMKGRMHGYMRMYWAKKILEWTGSPEQALEAAVYLNDKYELDGRDPNGYAGIAWSIGGVHDRAWNEREIFGKIRYMSYNGCKGKFDVNKYIAQQLT